MYGLQARSLFQADKVPRRLEEMAEDYLGVIRSIQPSGPYTLLGWSFGGLVAHAMATMIQWDGHEVASLILLDSYPIDRASVSSADAQQHDGGDELRKELEDLRREAGFASALESHHYDAMIEASKHNRRLAGAFVPRRFRGDVLLFAATEEESGPPVESWQPYVDGRIIVHAIACTHETMMHPLPAEQIGRMLGVALLKALGKRQQRGFIRSSRAAFNSMPISFRRCLPSRLDRCAIARPGARKRSAARALVRNAAPVACLSPSRLRGGKGHAGTPCEGVPAPQ